MSWLTKILKKTQPQPRPQPPASSILTRPVQKSGATSRPRPPTQRGGVR